MRFEAASLAIVLAIHSGAPARAEESARAADEARATLPLDELIRMHRDLDARQRAPEPPRPPLSATVDALELEGRLVERSLELQTKVQVTVLQEGWATVPLLRLGESLHVVSRPEIARANLAVKDGWLVLLAQSVGTYRFEVTLLDRRPADEGLSRIELETSQATLAGLRLQFDERLYRVEGAVTPEGDGVRVDPDGTRFRLAWQQKSPAAERPPAEPRPELEPVIPSASASLVSTLEGRWLTRILYELRFTGSRELDVLIRPGSRLTKVFLDRVPLPFTLEGDRLRLRLSPARTGGEQALLELVLEQEHGAYHLAGRLEVELPELSWPTHEVTLDVHLPPVFDYTWVDGSLSPSDASPAPSWSYELPEPGKRLSFRQLLVTRSAPRLALDYDVDLTNAYFVP